MIMAKGRNQPPSSLSQLWKFYLPISPTQSLACCRLGLILGQGKESNPHPTARILNSQISAWAVCSDSE